MLLGEPPRTQFDLNFVLFGFPVRVTPFFWLVALVLGMGVANQEFADLVLKSLTGVVGPDEELPDNWAFVLLWVVAVFLSIWLHELGHAIAFRYYGIDSQIVLYHFGGLAIPTGSAYSAYGYSRRMDSQAQIVISAAGPGAQLLLAAALFVIIRMAGFQVPYYDTLFGAYLPVGDGEPIPNAMLHMFVFFLLFPSIMWALLNLVPVYPLDGGQIAREVFLILNPRDGVRQSLMLSIFAGGGLALYSVMQGNLFLALMLGSLAFSSYQVLQAYSGRGGFGGKPW